MRPGCPTVRKGQGLVTSAFCLIRAMIGAGLVIGGIGTISCQSRQPLRPPGNPRDWNLALLKAAERGDVSEMTRWLDAGADPNFNPGGPPLGFPAMPVAPPLFRGDTANGLFQRPLINAVHSGNVRAVRLLLQRGALPNGRTIDETPLHAAAVRGFEDVVWTLLEAGANANARVGLGPTQDAMSLAIAYRHPGIIRALHAGGARLKPGDLCHAVAVADASLVDVFLDLGLDPRARQCDGLSALDRARMLPHFPAREKVIARMNAVTQTWAPR